MSCHAYLVHVYTYKHSHASEVSGGMGEHSLERQGVAMTAHDSMLFKDVQSFKFSPMVEQVLLESRDTMPKLPKLEAKEAKEAKEARLSKIP